LERNYFIIEEAIELAVIASQQEKLSVDAFYEQDEGKLL
jgi:hypothetical protein